MKKFRITSTEYEKRVIERVYVVEANDYNEAEDLIIGGKVSPTEESVADIEYDTGEEFTSSEVLEGN